MEGPTKKSENNNKNKEIPRLSFGEESVYPGGLCEDVLNFWSTFLPIESLEKKSKYKDSYPHPDDQKKFIKILEKSDSKAIVKYDILVKEFNEELEQIKQDGDKKKIKKYFNKVAKIVRNE